MSVKKEEKKPVNLKVFIATRQFFLTTAALVLTILVLLLAAIIPQINASWNLYNQMQAEKPKLEKLKSKLVELQNVQFAPEYAQKATVEQALPSYKPLIELLGSLNSVASTTGVSIDHFEINPGEIATSAASVAKKASKKSGGPENVDYMDLEIKVSGTFEQVTNFLVSVEKVSPFTSILTMSFGDANSESEEVVADRQLEATLETRTYFFTQSVKATVEAPLPKLTAEDQTVLSELNVFSAIEIPVQNNIQGGVEDLFQVDPLQF